LLPKSGVRVCWCVAVWLDSLDVGSGCVSSGCDVHADSAWCRRECSVKGVKSCQCWGCCCSGHFVCHWDSGCLQTHWSPLMYACMRCNNQAVQALIQAGANVHHCDKVRCSCRTSCFALLAPSHGCWWYVYLSEGRDASHACDYQWEPGHHEATGCSPL
jgi:hypothetical protein